ncbi:tyrosine-protein phosphatase [Thermopolyspora sp. NPDC052614]|uniref:tyrosine-protein phosphatase n=1 Tax=Thermopolyspora sp. NPDC052614 TaxID=3155682 RepID=UPI00341ADB36
MSNELQRWIVLQGAVNVRDLGGLPTVDGQLTRFGRILRADNLQGLTGDDVKRLVGELKLRNVVDLRSYPEVELEGPGPLARVGEVTLHHHTLFAEGGRFTDVEADTGPAIDGERVLPWRGERSEEDLAELRVTGYYYAYLRDRPDSVIAALRVLARPDGAAIVHCAAGKDRTGVLSALALEVAGVTREAIIADYVATGERLEQILARLRASDTYRADLDSRPADTHMPRPEYMARFLESLDTRFGGATGWLTAHGWTEEDHRALRSRLLD